jgi:hypothetical protein
MDNGFTSEIEAFEDWSEALDFQTDIHLELARTKDPVKRKRLLNTYNKAARVAESLKKTLCEKVLNGR